MTDSPSEQEPVSPPPDIPAPEVPRFRWSARDLMSFLAFFVLSVFFVPQNLSATKSVLAQGALDFAWVGFIFFLARAVHGESVRRAIHWFHNDYFRTGYLVALGSALAVSILIVSSLFPPKEPPPIEKFFGSNPSVYVFLAFGAFIAPLLEEIIFRGFIFNVVADLVSTRVAVPVTAVLFALVHAQQLWGSWAGIALIFVVGYVLSIARARSNSLIPSFIIHTSYNGTIFLLATVGTLVQGMPK